MRKHRNNVLKVRALRTRQGGEIAVYSFFLPGSELLNVASISRVARDEKQSLVGFQRKEIKNHVKKIVEFLDSGPVIFPNAIILALSNDVTFSRARGIRPAGLVDSAEMGTLSIPIFGDGREVAWIVDGQQRSLALARAKNNAIPVPVVGFVCEDVERQREQFILVNKAKPLPVRLINELLPEVSVYLPRDLALRKIPSELCNILNQDPASPFHNLIRRASSAGTNGGVVTDTALINVMKNSIRSPLGALATFKVGPGGHADIEGMYRLMLLFWGAAKEVFPHAWGLSPTKSRLMHSAGIEAMGYLMDRILIRAYGFHDPAEHVHFSLRRIVPHCRWTEGAWERLGLEWNQVQNVTRHIRLLADFLIHADYEESRKP